ncbi:RidA family protein [Asticcacaulis benevestitus]|nr:RidA family protein [Asticcacaulis benevestitus]
MCVVAAEVGAQAQAALGDLERVCRVMKLTVFVNSTVDFTDQPKIANGASELMVAAFGEKGRHTRSAVSAAALPLGVAVEVDAVLKINA